MSEQYSSILPFLPGGHGHEVELALIVPIIHTAQNQLAILVVSQVEASENTTVITGQNKDDLALGIPRLWCVKRGKDDIG